MILHKRGFKRWFSDVSDSDIDTLAELMSAVLRRQMAVSLMFWGDTEAVSVAAYAKKHGAKVKDMDQRQWLAWGALRHIDVDRDNAIRKFFLPTFDMSPDGVPDCADEICDRCLAQLRHELKINIYSNPYRFDNVDLNKIPDLTIIEETNNED